MAMFKSFGYYGDERSNEGYVLAVQFVDATTPAQARARARSKLLNLRCSAFTTRLYLGEMNYTVPGVKKERLISVSHHGTPARSRLK